MEEKLTIFPVDFSDEGDFQLFWAEIDVAGNWDMFCFIGRDGSWLQLSPNAMPPMSARMRHTWTRDDYRAVKLAVETWQQVELVPLFGI